MEKQPLHFIDNLAFIHLRGSETDGRCGVVEFYGPPGAQPPPHLHHEHDEAFYVLEGEITLYVADQEIVLKQGEFHRAPKRIPHTTRTSSETNARWLVTSIPAGFEAFVEEYAEPAPEADLPKGDAPPDLERLEALSKKYGIEMLGPPGLLPKDLPAAS